MKRRSALDMIARCAKHQPEDARFATTREISPCYSTEPTPQASEDVLPDPDHTTMEDYYG